VAAGETELDPRDVMVGMATPHVVAGEISAVPATVFGAVANRLPPGPTTDLLREFGARRDINLTAFGWRMVITDAGPDFAPDDSWGR
jgi:hypothetical protein